MKTLKRKELLKCLILLLLLFQELGSGGLLFGDASTTRIVFGSCSAEDRSLAVFDTIAELRPDLFIFLGDNIYADTTKPQVMRAKYRRLAQGEPFQRLRQACPLMATWDDHDYGRNDAGADYPMKRESEQIFLDFWEEPLESPRRARPGVYTAKLLGSEAGRVQVILLDTRYFRGPLILGRLPTHVLGPYVANQDPQADLLGEAQWIWLEEQLRVPARLRIIVSSIQVLVQPSGWEGWANFPHQKERLFTLLKRTGAEGVIFLSGDRHYGEITRFQPPDYYPLYEVTSSGLNVRHPNGRPSNNRYRRGEAFMQENFGSLIIHWQQEDPEIKLQVQDTQGRVKLEETLKLSSLRIPGA